MNEKGWIGQPITFRYSSCCRLSFSRSVPQMQCAWNWGMWGDRHQSSPVLVKEWLRSKSSTQGWIKHYIIASIGPLYKLNDITSSLTHPQRTIDWTETCLVCPYYSFARRHVARVCSHVGNSEWKHHYTCRQCCRNHLAHDGATNTPVPSKGQWNSLNKLQM